MDSERPPVTDRRLTLIAGSENDWEPPTQFDGYELRGCIGKGAMGRVYKAYEHGLHRLVAIKFVEAVDRSEPQVYERFLLEARAIARLQHPNVVAIYRIGEVQGRPYIAYEWVKGETLDQLALPLLGERVLQIGIGLARGLAAVHQHNVLHRDIKPGNVILAEGREAKLLDFGLAKFVGESNEDFLEPTNAVAVAMSVGKTAKAAATSSRSKVGSLREADPEKTQELRYGASTAHENATSDLTQSGVLIGTPAYVAPEIWEGEQATYRSDVYSVGAVLYQLYAGHPPHRVRGMEALRASVLEKEAKPLPAATDMDRQLTTIIHRCLSRDPTARFATATELRDALEAATPEKRAITLPEGNPYRGLQAFEADHRALFFGRRNEIRALLDQLRHDAFVFVLGPSGVGKSSLCRAGVLPWISDFGLSDDRRWTTVVMTPGKRPVFALAAVLAPYLGVDKDALAVRIRTDWNDVYSELCRRPKIQGPFLIFVDQLEELITLSDKADAEVMATVIESFSIEEPGLRLLATLRADFLVRFGWLPGISSRITRSAYLLKPMGPEGIREAIVGPAEAKGVAFESNELVEELVKSTAEADGALPLLQFTLAELWDARDKARNVISASALATTGGVTGALARHADRVLSRLPADQRRATRRLLPLLVTLEGTRARHTERDLGAENETDRAALAALIQGRLLTVSESPEGPAYEVAHEALINSWPTLQRWLEEDAKRRELRGRLSTAIAEWERLGRKREGLWSARQLSEVATLLDRPELLPREAAFLDASYRAVRFRRRFTGALGIGLVVALSGTYTGLKFKAQRDLTAQVRAHVNEGLAFLSRARAKNQQTEQMRQLAYSLFDSKHVDQGEEIWSRAGDSAADTDKFYRESDHALEAAVALGKNSSAAKSLLADVLYERALLAERDGKSEAKVEFLARMILYDDGTRQAKWNAPGNLDVEVMPAGVQVTVQQYKERERENPSLETVRANLATPIQHLELPQGSYLLLFSAPGRADVRYPVLVRRGEQRRISFELPYAASIPEGFVYIPPGPFLFGSLQPPTIRKDFLFTVPLHEVTTGAYLIAEHETTFGDWLEYLNALGPAEALRRAAELTGPRKGQLSLRPVAQDWELTLRLNSREHVMRLTDHFHIPERKARQDQDWRLLPVVGVSMAEINDYLFWRQNFNLSIRPRLCSEFEWERAARGADGREYPHGNLVFARDANCGDTYGGKATTIGPDEVGAFSASRSPFVVDDMCGNAAEFTRSSLQEGEYVLRGGSYAETINQIRSTNRQVVLGTDRSLTVGVRLCADLK